MWFLQLITLGEMKQRAHPGNKENKAEQAGVENSITIRCIHGLFLNSEQVFYRWNSWWSEVGWACAGCWCDSLNTPAVERQLSCRRGLWVIRLQMRATKKKGGVNKCVYVCLWMASWVEKPQHLLCRQTKAHSVICNIEMTPDFSKQQRMVQQKCRKECKHK